MWIALGSDSTLASQIMDMMIEKLSVVAPYVDKKESMLRPGVSKVATSAPLAVSSPALARLTGNFHCCP